MTTFCHKCGTQAIDDKSLFCNKCGTQLIQDNTEKNVDCPNCGTKILDNESVFCSQCGSSLSLPKERSHNGKTNNILTPDSAKSDPYQKTYPPNTLLVGLFLLTFLCPLLNIPLLVIIFLIVMSAIAVRFDAQEIGAGLNVVNGSRGSLSYTPRSWFFLVLLLWIYGYPLYLIRRREIFYANNSEMTPVSPSSVSEAYTAESEESKEVYIPPVNDNVNRSQKSTSQKPLKRPSMLLPAILLLFGFVLIIWIIFQTGVLNSVSSIGTVTTSQEDVIYHKDISSMGLTINDLPNGWIGGGGSPTTGNTYSTSFVRASGLSPEIVGLNITKLSTIDNAKQEYNSLKTQAPSVKIESINLGNEGFGYVYANDIWVIFRKGNVIVKIENVKLEYDYSPSINDAKKYAEIVANRINS